MKISWKFLEKHSGSTSPSEYFCPSPARVLSDLNFHVEDYLRFLAWPTTLLMIYISVSFAGKAAAWTHHYEAPFNFLHSLLKNIFINHIFIICKTFIFLRTCATLVFIHMGLSKTCIFPSSLNPTLPYTLNLARTPPVVGHFQLHSSKTLG